MFCLKLEPHLELALVQPSFARYYVELVKADFDYLDQWLVWPEHCQTEASFLQFISKSLHGYADGKSLTCAMIFDGDVVGNISFNSICKDVKSAEIGYWLSSKYQGKGIVTRSVTALIEMAFHQLELEKVQISAAVGNTPSRAVCERLGFKLEGIITNAENLNGRIVDHAIYAMRKENWVNNK